MATEEEQRQLELEIGAFQGPHIKRARIVLVLVGALYALSGYMNYGDVKRFRADVNSWTGPHTPRFEELQHLASLAYYAVVFVTVAGVANILLALIAGKKTTLAFYIAMGIFVALSAFQLYISGGLLLTNFIWWITAISLGLGFQAAMKAEKMRRGQV
jgi:hypothetical protein